MSELNPIAKLILECFEESVPFKEYIDNQREILNNYGDNIVGVLVYAIVKLDGDNRMRLADKMGISVEHLDYFDELLNKAYSIK